MNVRAAAGARSRQSDRGFTLIEVLMAVALMSIAVIGVLPAIWTNVRSSGLQDQFGGARRWIVSAGEYAVSPSLARTSCTSATIVTDYQNAIRTGVTGSRPPAWTDSRLSVTGVQFWNGTTFGATCLESAGLTLQLVSLKVISPDGRVTETLDVVKGS